MQQEIKDRGIIRWIQTWSLFFAGLTVIIYPIAVTFSRSAPRVLDILLIVYWLCQGNYRERIRAAWTHPVLFWGVLYLLVTFGGVFLAPLTLPGVETITYRRAFEFFLGHQPLLLLLVVATLPLSPTYYLRMAQVTFCCMTVAVGQILWLQWSYGLDYYTAIRTPKVFFISQFHMALGVFVLLSMSLLLFTPLHWLASYRVRLFTKYLKYKRWLSCLLSFVVFVCSVALVSFLVYFLFGVLHGCRTSQVAFVVAMAAVYVARFRLKGVIFAALLVAPFTPVIVTYTHHISKRYDGMVRELTTLIEPKPIARSEKGGRIAVYNYLLNDVVIKSPVLGIGIGKGQIVSESVTGGEIKNPHSEYLNVLVQSGGVGFVTFLGFCSALFFYSLRMKKRHRFWALFITVVFLTDSLVNCSLSYNRGAYFYPIFFLIILHLEKSVIRRPGRQCD